MEWAQDVLFPSGELHWNPASSSKQPSPPQHSESLHTLTQQHSSTHNQLNHNKHNKRNNHKNKKENKYNKYKNQKFVDLRTAHKHKKRKGRYLNKFNSKQRRQMKIALEGLPSGSAGLPRELAHSGDQVVQASQVNRKRNTKRGLRSKQK